MKHNLFGSQQIEHPLDHDFIRTREGYFFTVVGYLHPPDRIFSYLKYIPAREGKWRDGSQPLERVLPHYSAAVVRDTFSILKKRFPQYLYDCPVNNIKMIAVPKSDIFKYYRPREAVSRLLRSDHLDSLQKKALDLVEELSDVSGVPKDFFGLTGSLLIGIHDPAFSDIDLTVHGHDNSKLVEKTLLDLWDENRHFKRMSIIELEEWKRRKTSQFNLESEIVEILARRKWNMGYYKEKKISVHPIHLKEELKDFYGDEKYIPKGVTAIEARVTNDEESFYLPCKYEIADV
ncbi:MAG: hypothetical protein ACXQS8_02845, partial [Candidatus Helarchaeales archaeon]